MPVHALRNAACDEKIATRRPSSAAASPISAAFSRCWWLWSLTAVGWTIPVGLALGEGYWQYLLSRGMGYGGMHRSILWTFAAAPALVAATIVVNLLLLRALGIRWVSVARAS